MKKAFILFVMLITGLSISKAQSGSKQNDTKQINVEGTYQIEMINTRDKPSLPVELAKIVSENRDTKEVKYIMLAPKTRLKILPLSEINKPDFKPLNKITYVSK